MVLVSKHLLRKNQTQLNITQSPATIWLQVMMTLRGGVMTGVGCLAAVLSSAWRAVPRTAPAPAWDGLWVTAPTRGLLRSGGKEQQAVTLAAGKEQTL